MHMLYDACYMMHAACYLLQAPVRDLPATLVLCGHAAALTLHCTMCTSSVARGRRRISSNSNLTCNPNPNPTPDHGRRHVDALGVRPAGHSTRAAAQGSSQVAWDGLARGAAEDVRGRALIHKLREAH